MRLPLLAALAAVALAGCQAGSEPGLQPADPSTGASAAEAAEPGAGPLRFFSSGGRVVYQCFPEGVRRFVLFEQVRPRRPVTLTGLTGGGEAMQVVRTWVAPLAPGAIPESGAIDLGAGGTSLADIDAWPDRQPLRGAELEPGTTYTFFVRADVRPDLTLADVRLAWDDGTTTGESAFDNAGRTRSGGC